MKKRFFYNHPILGGVIGLAIAFVVCNVIGFMVMAPGVFAEFFASFQDGLISTNDEAQNLFLSLFLNDKNSSLFNGTVAIAALLALPFFWWLNRKNGFRGSVRILGRNLKDVWVCIAIFVVFDVAIELLCLMNNPGGFPQIPAPTAALIVLAIYAGVNEEIIDRAIPVALMMRNKPTSRRIWQAILVTSIIFGLTHFINLGEKQDLKETVLQVIFAFTMGLFFVGIYLRTGSIVIGAVIHMLHDLMIFTGEVVLVEDKTSFFYYATYGTMIILPAVLGIIMLLPKHHPEILDVWTRIWPEKKED